MTLNCNVARAIMGLSSLASAFPRFQILPLVRLQVPEVLKYTIRITQLDSLKAFVSTMPLSQMAVSSIQQKISAARALTPDSHP
mmetsp:Transcript_22147/g.40665  ORF Transcript_22147/g.40665 Transcript_22147/m.40665 type:complete len:84 (-) Transcript_22147:1832-2083(-)